VILDGYIDIPGPKGWVELGARIARQMSQAGVRQLGGLICLLSASPERVSTGRVYHGSDTYTWLFHMFCTSFALSLALLPPSPRTPSVSL
jgi:hypothetical protein